MRLLSAALHRVTVVLFATTTLVVALAAHAGEPMPDFVPGQEWSIKSASPTTAKIIIGRVEPWRNTVSVSVSIVEIPIPQGAPGAGGVTQVDHVPFEKSVLIASVDRLVATNVSPSPKFEGGYGQWKNAQGGIFTISVEKAIEIVFLAASELR